MSLLTCVVPVPSLTSTRRVQVIEIIDITIPIVIQVHLVRNIFSAYNSRAPILPVLPFQSLFLPINDRIMLFRISIELVFLTINQRDENIKILYNDWFDHLKNVDYVYQWLGYTLKENRRAAVGGVLIKSKPSLAPPTGF